MYDGQVYLAPFILILLTKMIETVVTEEKYIILEKKNCSYFVNSKRRKSVSKCVKQAGVYTQRPKVVFAEKCD